MMHIPVSKSQLSPCGTLEKCQSGAAFGPEIQSDKSRICKTKVFSCSIQHCGKTLPTNTSTTLKHTPAAPSLK